ncbi:MAG: phosphoadenosine phosphosulfate reductase family protein [Firmicutes bacterium]|nr:phosphoadenosine phosphosulfate reductase family protein [Bacillota bacterium]
MSEEKVKKSKQALKLAARMSKQYYGKPLIISYSGGKDSSVMLDLAERFLQPEDYEVMYNHTSADAPQTVQFIRAKFSQLSVKGVNCTDYIPKYKDGTQITMWNLIPKKRMPPTRIVRYCCQKLKEASTPNRMCAVGVRKSESTGRMGRDIFSIIGKTKNLGQHYSLEHAKEVYQESNEIDDPNWDCNLIKNMKQNKNIVVNPIYEWSDRDIWEYITKYGLKINPLYYPPYNYKRVGCIGCPMATLEVVKKEFSDFPQYKQAYIKAFDRMIEERKKAGLITKWNNGYEVYHWWINDDHIPGQMKFNDDLNIVKEE